MGVIDTLVKMPFLRALNRGLASFVKLIVIYLRFPVSSVETAKDRLPAISDAVGDRRLLTHCATTEWPTKDTQTLRVHFYMRHL